jgi:hypothetical protein
VSKAKALFTTRTSARSGLKASACQHGASRLVSQSART